MPSVLLVQVVVLLMEIGILGTRSRLLVVVGLIVPQARVWVVDLYDALWSASVGWLRTHCCSHVKIIEE